MDITNPLTLIAIPLLVGIAGALITAVLNDRIKKSKGNVSFRRLLFSIVLVSLAIFLVVSIEFLAVFQIDVKDIVVQIPVPRIRISPPLSDLSLISILNITILALIPLFGVLIVSLADYLLWQGHWRISLANQPASMCLVLTFTIYVLKTFDSASAGTVAPTTARLVWPLLAFLVCYLGMIITVTCLSPYGQNKIKSRIGIVIGNSMSWAAWVYVVMA